MGDEADDVLHSFALSDADSKKYDKVKEQFDAYFVRRKNVIFKRARFNQQKQEEGETIEAFIASLYKLAEYCSYGKMHNEMIRDRLVVGLHDTALSRKLQLEADLTLDSATTTARQTEAVKNQQEELRNTDSSSSDKSVNKISTRDAKGPKTQPQRSACTRCGRAPPHDFQQCPARNKICHRCKKCGHFQTCCCTPDYVTDIEQEEDSELFLGTIHRKRGDQWKVTLQLDGQLIEFRIDMGADVTIIPKEMYIGLAHKHLQKAHTAQWARSQHLAGERCLYGQTETR